MSSVSATSSNSNDVAQAAAGATTQVLGQDDFLKLLMAQMQNQDPTQPTDDTQFVAELAQFSSVEQMTDMNDTMNQLLVAQASANQTADANLVGKTVKYNSSTVTVGATTPVQLGGTLSGAASDVTATITDSNGKVVRTIDFGSAAAGNWKGNWDGTDSNGNAVAPGNYTVSLSATDSSGNPLTTTTQTSGVISGVNFSSGAAQLVVNGQTITMSNVIEIDQTGSGN